jgi:UDP-N-acetylmuramoyl-tripeptide--D-alanyl-D-alanine ligase
VNANFSLDDLLRATGARLIKGSASDFKSGNISTDTRTLNPGDIYLPLKGPNFDGHNFIAQALEKGAAGILVETTSLYNIETLQDAFILEVPNTLTALLEIACYHRMRLNAKIIAITGSSGKTTSKELLHSVLCIKFNVYRSEMNYNNEIGVSKTLLEAGNDKDIIILEMGMRGPGEIDLLVKYALPDLAVITNVGPSHIGRLGSMENIAKAKAEILNYLGENNGVAFLYGEDQLLLNTARMTYQGKMHLFGQKDNYEIKEYNREKTIFSYKGESYQLNVPGEHNVINATCAIEIAHNLGLTDDQIRQGLLQYKPIFGRWVEYPVFENTIVINDAYNANPDSTRAAINTVFKVFPDRQIWLVLGDMLELGDYEVKMHEEVGQWLNDKPVHTLITVGKLSQKIVNTLNKKVFNMVSFENSEKAGLYIKEQSPNNAVILLKASRGIGLERILPILEVKDGGDSH